MPTGTSHLPGPLSAAVAQLILEAIDKGNASQSRVATAADISKSQLSRVLSGQKVFTLEELDRVCSALRLDIAYVIQEADARSRNARTRKPDNVIVGGFGQNAGTDDEHLGESWEVADGPIEYDGKLAAKKGTRKADDLPHAE